MVTVFELPMNRPHLCDTRYSKWFKCPFCGGEGLNKDIKECPYCHKNLTWKQEV